MTLIHRFVRRFCHVKMAVDAFLKPPLEAPKSPVSDTGPSDAFVLPLEDKHKLLAPRKASLRGFYDFLESSGETFEGGYPYDQAKWRPLQLLLTVWESTSRRWRGWNLRAIAQIQLRTLMSTQVDKGALLRAPKLYKM